MQRRFASDAESKSRKHITHICEVLSGKLARRCPVSPPAYVQDCDGDHAALIRGIRTTDGNRSNRGSRDRKRRLKHGEVVELFQLDHQDVPYCSVDELCKTLRCKCGGYRQRGGKIH